MGGDFDIAAVAALMAEPTRARMLLALDRDRALPASVLAAESGVAPSTASGHLARLLDAGFLSVEEHDRHRYYRLADPAVAEALETMARLAPVSEVRSPRQGTKAAALRRARSCSGHLAGRAGTEVMAAMVDRGWLTGGDGRFHSRAGGRDRPSAPGSDVVYRLTGAGLAGLSGFGIDVGVVPGPRPLIRYCVDWSELRHHLAGRLGAAVLARLHDLDWVRRTPTHRALTVTAEGLAGLRATFGADLDA
jgi:DNA-binding transcriptional ArsR family regulator